MKKRLALVFAMMWALVGLAVVVPQQAQAIPLPITTHWTYTKCITYDKTTNTYGLGPLVLGQQWEVNTSNNYVRPRNWNITFPNALVKTGGGVYINRYSPIYTPDIHLSYLNSSSTRVSADIDYWVSLTNGVLSGDAWIGDDPTNLRPWRPRNTTFTALEYDNRKGTTYTAASCFVRP